METSLYREEFLSSDSDAPDEYHEDELPDLVLDARPSSACLLLDDKGLLDLLQDHPSFSLSASHLPESPRDLSQVDDTLLNTEGHSLLDYYNDDSVHLDKNKVSYTDHSKAYVSPRKSGVYRSYLSLLPSENPADSPFTPGKSPLSKTSSEESFLEKFQSLDSSEQNSVRQKWRQDLSVTQVEIRDLRVKLGERVEEALQLKKLLGISFSWKDRIDYLRSLAKTAKASILDNFD